MSNAEQPAFPTQEIPQPENSDGTCHQQWQPLEPGLTKRQWFAGMAMQGMLANERWMERIIENVSGTAWPHIKNLAFDMADAMLKEAPDAE